MAALYMVYPVEQPVIVLLSLKTRRDDLISRAVEARLPLLTGDTTRTIARLRALKPNASRVGIAWEPWESLGPERLLLARLLLARRDYAGALRAASLLDATEPISYPMLLRASLELRTRAAEGMNNATLAGEFRRRLAQLALGSS